MGGEKEWVPLMRVFLSGEIQALTTPLIIDAPSDVLDS